MTAAVRPLGDREVIGHFRDEKVIQTIDIPYGIPAHEEVWVERVRELAVAFRERAAAYGESGELPLENLAALHAEGIDTLFFPTELGGHGISHQTFGEIVRTLSEADPATACIWLMHVGAAVALAQRTTGTLGTYYTKVFFADSTTRFAGVSALFGSFRTRRQRFAWPAPSYPRRTTIGDIGPYFDMSEVHVWKASASPPLTTTTAKAREKRAA